MLGVTTFTAAYAATARWLPEALGRAWLSGRALLIAGGTASMLALVLIVPLNARVESLKNPGL